MSHTLQEIFLRDPHFVEPTFMGALEMSSTQSTAAREAALFGSMRDEQTMMIPESATPLEPMGLSWDAITPDGQVPLLSPSWWDHTAMSVISTCCREVGPPKQVFCAPSFDTHPIKVLAVIMCSMCGIRLAGHHSNVLHLMSMHCGCR